MSNIVSRLNLPGVEMPADGTGPFFDQDFAAAGLTVPRPHSATATQQSASVGARARDDARAAPRTGAAPLGGRPKRLIDIVISLVATVLLSPLLLMTAVLVRVFIGRRIIFAHTRIGLNGEAYVCYKFRTMGADADDVFERYLAANPEAAEEWRETQKLKDDPRVCSLGKILRRSSLDELPQLFNVLRGDMSIIGPRPIVASELDRYGVHARRCFRARPGLSGIWQVNGRNRVSYRRRVVLDRYYVGHWSIWLDLMILLKTVPALLKFDETA
jgi:exopolysaccharide production protein ExoY